MSLQKAPDMLNQTIDRRPPTGDQPIRRGGIVNLEAVRDRAMNTATGMQQRDLASAFRFVEARLQVDLAATPATATVLRKLFATASSAALGITAKRLENVRSIVAKAVERHGMARQYITRRVDLTPAWAALIGQIERKEYRCAHSRLACYCSANGIEPADVTPETLVAFMQRWSRSRWSRIHASSSSTRSHSGTWRSRRSRRGLRFD